MLPIHHVETFLQRTPADLQDIVFELRNIIISAAPDAVEVIRWGGLSYYHEGRGGLISAGICQIEIQEHCVRLAFIHGAFLADPLHRLEGHQKAKRFLRLNSFDDAPWEYLKELIQEAAQFDPRTLQP
jgi:hypothetical protein